MYRTKEFSKMIGLPPSKLRYYEELGLLQIRRDENGYRYYSPYDAFKLNKFRSLRNLGFSVEDSIKAFERIKEGSFKESLYANQLKMKKEMALLQSRIDYNQWHIAALDAVNDNPSAISQVSIEPYYFIPASKELDFSVSKSTHEPIFQWCEYFPIVRQAILLAPDKFLNLAVVPDNYGFAVPVSQAKKLELFMCDEVKHLELGRCISFFSITDRQRTLGISKIEYVNDYLEQNKLCICGELLMLPFSAEISGKIDSIKYVIAPVK